MTTVSRKVTISSGHSKFLYCIVMSMKLNSSINATKQGRYGIRMRNCGKVKPHMTPANERKYRSGTSLYRNL